MCQLEGELSYPLRQGELHGEALQRRTDHPDPAGGFVRFLVDAQLPVALAHWLSSIGDPSEHVVDCGLLDADDSRIWRFAADGGLAIVTKNESLALRRNLASTGPTVVWVRKGNVRNTVLLARFGDALLVLVDALQQGEPALKRY